jgi:hypothetical protein
VRASGNISATSRGRDLLDVDAAVAVERRHPPVLLEPAGVGGELDEPDRLEPGGEAGLGLEARVQVAGVRPQLGRGLRRRTERDHQPRRVPRGARGELVALDQHRVGPPEMTEVVRDRRADHPTADDDDPSPIRNRHALGALVPGDRAAEAVGQGGDAFVESCGDGGGLFVVELAQQEQSGGSLDEGGDLGAVVAAHDQVAFPVTGDLAVGDLVGPLGDQHLVRDR